MIVSRRIFGYQTHRAVFLLNQKTVSSQSSPVLHQSCLEIKPSFNLIPRRTMTSGGRDLFYNDIVALSNKKEIILIDVREPEEIQETGKLPGSTHIPLGDIPSALNLDAETFREKYGMDKPSVDASLVFSCRSGKRSLVALEKALSMGFSNSRHYAGGWLDWEKHATK